MQITFEIPDYIIHEVRNVLDYPIQMIDPNNCTAKEQRALKLVHGWCYQLEPKPTKKTRDDRHGGPYDRGAADSYYNRPRKPHYYEGGTGRTQEIGEDHMTPEQIEDYNAGYDDNEKAGNHK